MWIVRVARTRPYTFILLALLILMLSPLVILRTRNDIFPSVNIPAIAVARAAGIAGGEAASAPLRMSVIKRLPTEEKPDGIAYAAPFHKAYVSNERAKAESIIDVRTDTIVKVLRFDSETGVPQYDPVARKVYVNLQDRNIFAVIDPAKDAVVGRHPVQGCRGNHGMALDPEHHRAFLSCEGNDTLTVFNLDTHQAIAFLPMASGPDVIKLDPGLKRIYVACSSGAISVFQMDDPDHYRKLEDFPVQKKVHSLAVDPETHRVYAPEQEEAGKAVARMVVYEAVVR